MQTSLFDAVQPTLGLTAQPKEHKPVPEPETSPDFMDKHRAIKSKYPDAIVFIRHEGFYLAFGRDATAADGFLPIAIVHSPSAHRHKLVVDFAQFDDTLRRLTKAGFKVAIQDDITKVN